MKNENRKSKTGNRGRGPTVASLRREGSSLQARKERIANFELWFSNWVVHRD